MSTTEITAQDIINAQTNAKIEILAQEMKDFKDEMKDFKNEMRDRDNRRADEIATVNAKYDAEIKAINSRIDEKFEKMLILSANILKVFRKGFFTTSVTAFHSSLLVYLS